MPTKFTSTYTLQWTPKGVTRRVSPGQGRQVFKAGSAAITALSNGIGEMGRAVEGESESIVRQYTEQHSRDAEAIAPMLTGELRSKFSTEYEKRPGLFVGKSINKSEYAAYMEYGFHHWRNGRFVRPRAFMFPAFAPLKAKFIQAIRGIFG